MQNNAKNNPFSLAGLLPAKSFAKTSRLIERGLESVSGLADINNYYHKLSDTSDSDKTFRSILDILKVNLDINKTEFSNIPKQGPVVVVANHPFGALDGVILTMLLREHRDDVKVMANYHLSKIPEVADCFISVDPFATENSHRRNMKPLKESLNWLKQGGLLLVFPAGEVSNFSFKKMRIMDSEWNPTIGRLITLSGASVNPVYFHGRNSLLFNVMGLIHPLLRTCLLPRELLKKIGKTIRLQVGKEIPNSKLMKLNNSEELMSYLKLRTYMLAEVNTKQSQHIVSSDSFENIIQQPDVDVLTSEVNKIADSQCLITSGDLSVYYAKAEQIPWLMQEIGRLRELTFRAVGEGTGKKIDIDLYDSYYMHLFIWNTKKQEVIGAYRLGIASDIIKKYGKKGLYTYSLFHYKNKLIPQLHNAIELGRSFIRIEYQKSFQPLNILWKGISAYVAMQREYPILFGPVSISRDYKIESQKLIIGALKNNSFNKEFAKYVRARNPFKSKQRYRWQTDDLRVVNDIELVSDMVSQIESDKKGIPVLVKQYLRLGGQFLGFNIDPQFNDVVDGLIVVDFRQTDMKILEKLMGKDIAHAFREYHETKKATSNKQETFHQNVN